MLTWNQRRRQMEFFAESVNICENFQAVDTKPEMASVGREKSYSHLDLDCEKIDFIGKTKLF